jgi:hypothetical protein
VGVSVRELRGDEQTSEVDLIKRRASRESEANESERATTQTRAGDRVRTGDVQLGRLTLYQLSYSRRDFGTFLGRGG